MRGTDGEDRGVRKPSGEGGWLWRPDIEVRHFSMSGSARLPDWILGE
jgi:hypothetical protein